MDVKIKKGKAEREPAEVILIGLFDGDPTFPEETAAVDRALKGQIRGLVDSGEFRAKKGRLHLHPTLGAIPAKRVLLVGLGKRADFDLEALRRAMGPAARRVREAGLTSLATPIHGRGENRISAAQAAQALVEGLLLGLYQFNAYRTENRDEIREVEQISLIDTTAGKIGDVAGAARRGQILAEATNYARDLCNHPSNVITPTRLAEEALGIARDMGLECRIIEKEEAESLGMGAFLGVARGSQERPKFIILEYHGGKKKGRPVVLVGKSITFDSGGISIKPAEKMEQMKYDMSGGAAVLGTLRAVAALRLPVSLVGLLPATENMPSGTAVKPGDVIRTLSGKTVEVINTDAEGRLILADALAFADRYKPAAVVDLATLTGACVVALGSHAVGVLGTHPKLVDQLKRAGERSGERIWELPLWEEYDEQIRSDVADVKNTGGRGGGTITAAAFLRKFVGNYPWAHLDIAGTAWADEARPYTPKGSTGVGVRLLVEWLSNLPRGNA